MGPVSNGAPPCPTNQSRPLPMKFVATKTVEQLDLQALHRVRDGWLASAPASSIRFAPSCWNAGLRCARASAVSAQSCQASSPRALMHCRWPMMRAVEDLASNWRRLDERIEGSSADICKLDGADSACERLITVRGIGPIISSAMVAALGNLRAPESGGRRRELIFLEDIESLAISYSGSRSEAWRSGPKRPGSGR